ncbi:MAG: folylpolyglutamate synthase/dihydrofolate synthase family protein, partial [Pseudomonadota bacterium]
LDRVVRHLGRIGDPHKALPPVIHVAGTNGKGSTIAFLKAMAEAAGLAVHVYTSPHLVRFHERIQLAAPGGAAPIEDGALADILSECEAAAGEDPITFFEITTCAAFLAFSRRPADLVLLEVGLGGRLDATNVIDRPEVAVIAPVGLDHQAYLGDTVGQIAREKAGILKTGAPGVVGVQSEEARAAIEETAARLAAPLRIAGEDWTAHLEHGRLVYRDEDGVLDLAPPRLIGAHQLDNAGLAVAALRSACAVQIGADAMSAGIEAAKWPGRMQRLTSGPLAARVAESAQGRGELWLDGGHNPHAARALAHAAADLAEKAPMPLTLICAMQQTKDPAGFFEAFAGLAETVICTPSPSGAALSPDALARAAQSQGVPAATAGDLNEALDIAVSKDGEPRRILICGSLYLAGATLKANGPS